MVVGQIAWMQWALGALHGGVDALRFSCIGGASVLGGWVSLNANCANSGRDRLGGGVSERMTLVTLRRQVDPEVGDKLTGGVEDCHNVETESLGG